ACGVVSSSCGSFAAGSVGHSSRADNLATCLAVPLSPLGRGSVICLPPCTLLSARAYPGFSRLADVGELRFIHANNRLTGPKWAVLATPGDCFWSLPRAAREISQGLRRQTPRSPSPPA